MSKNLKYGVFLIVLLLANNFFRKEPVDLVLILTIVYFFTFSYLYSAFKAKWIFFLINTGVITLFFFLQDSALENFSGNVFLIILFSIVTAVIFHVINIDK